MSRFEPKVQVAFPSTNPIVYTTSRKAAVSKLEAAAFLYQKSHRDEDRDAPHEGQAEAVSGLGLTFCKPYEVPEQAQRPVAYATKRELVKAIREQGQKEQKPQTGGFKSSNEVK